VVEAMGRNKSNNINIYINNIYINNSINNSHGALHSLRRYHPISRAQIDRQWFFDDPR
jgi:hypothetical protein